VPFEELAGDDPDTPATSLALGEPVLALPALQAAGLELAPADGRPTAIYAWASWCQPCVGPPLRAFGSEGAALADRLHAVAVSYLDEPSAAVEVFEATGATIPLFHDEREELERWGLSGVPALILLDDDGRLLGAYAGDLGGDDVRAILAALAAGEPLPEVGGHTIHQLP
jgi:thiol-disulfide isomerase/thioredoxin